MLGRSADDAMTPLDSSLAAAAVATREGPCWWAVLTALLSEGWALWWQWWQWMGFGISIAHFFLLLPVGGQQASRWAKFLPVGGQSFYVGGNF